MILKFSEMNPGLLNDLEFSMLIKGFVPSLSLPNKRLTGVRLMEKTASTVKVLADSGIVLEPLESFTEEQMAALDEAKISEDKYWQNAMEGLARIEESKKRAIARKEELRRHEEETKRQQAKLKSDTISLILSMAARSLMGGFSSQSDGASESHSDDIRRYRNEYEVRQNEMAKSDGREPPYPTTNAGQN